MTANDTEDGSEEKPANTTESEVEEVIGSVVSGPVGVWQRESEVQIVFTVEDSQDGSETAAEVLGRLYAVDGGTVEKVSQGDGSAGESVYHVFLGF